MPRPKKPGAPEPKRRSRKGCWPCKARKVKCGEEKPSCVNCKRQGELCDYSIRLNWEGRTKRKATAESSGFRSSNIIHSGNAVPFRAPSSDSTRVGPGSLVQAATSPQDGASPGSLVWDLSFPGNMTQRTPGSPVAAHEQSQGHLWYGNKGVPPGMSPPSQLHDQIAPWPSPLLSTVVPNEVVPRYHPSLQHSLDGISYPSPADTSSSMGSTSALTFVVQPVSQPPLSSLRQPLDTSNHSLDCSSPESDGLLNRQPKRLKLPHHPSFSEFQTTESVTSFSGNASYQPAGMPLSSASPANSSVPQGGFLSKVINGPFPSGRSSLQSRSSELEEGSDQVTEFSAAESKWHAYLTTVTDNYGLDCGRPDLDLNRNNDHAAIDINYALDLVSSMWKNASTPRSVDYENEFEEQNPDRSQYAYYASPVPINIPRYLSPLPSSLLENPINLMYFHHFLNHTAKMLVPHDCGDNPFISVMPSMAIGDPNLLNLMLAYSASHRARYLEHPEPANRIAHWVSNVFPTLRVALDGPHENITDSHLATAIMLLSLKIISPSTFEVPITWQSHLKLARDLFLARGGEQMAHPGNNVGAFLARWLGYLDLLGTLSCRHNEPPFPNTAYHYVVSVCSATGGFDESCVDCFSGFTARTSIFLTRLGQLVHRCDNERFDERGNFRSDWDPSPDTLLDGQALLSEFGDLHERAHINGTHYRDSEAKEILAVDQAFRCAGLLHLHRRVLNSPPYSLPVMGALNRLIDALNQLEPGGSAEVGVLFPLFTAGCETRDPQLRMEIMERIIMLQRTGMKQIQNAGRLMQRCWDEDLPWIALAQGEFLG